MKAPRASWNFLTEIHYLTSGLRSFGSLGNSLANDLEKGNYEAVQTASIEPSGYSDSESFFIDYCAVSYLRKAEFLPSNVDKEAVALEKFYESERTCRRVNEEFEMTPFLYKVRSIISDILPPLTIENLQDNMRFGPGASSSVTRKNANLLSKLRSRRDCTFAALPLIDRLIGDNSLGESIHRLDLGPARRKYNIVSGARLTFVPKDARTHRGICIEPDLNIIGQLGLGGVIHQALNKAYSRQHSKNGLDFKKFAPSYNAFCARKGSIDGSFATIDLRSASDTLSLCLLDLLPYEYRLAILALRSPQVTYNDRTITLEKISSMGNGFTFELETLIFYAFMRAIGSVQGCVFGDDIVVEQELALHLIEELQRVGFSVNHEKTFIHGPFRESCGKDYFDGRLVRPFFFKKAPESIGEVLSHINNWRRLSVRLGIYCSDKRLRRHWERLLRGLERVIGTIPYVIWDGIDTAVWSPDRRSSRKHEYPCIIEKPFKKLRAMRYCEAITHMRFSNPAILTERSVEFERSTSICHKDISWHPWA